MVRESLAGQQRSIKSMGLMVLMLEFAPPPLIGQPGERRICGDHDSRIQFVTAPSNGVS